MNLNEFAKEVHENAVAHGFWDKPDPFDKICADIISELSEALREYEAGRPMEWHVCEIDITPCTESECKPWKGYGFKESAKPYKPEGIAVEMADCAMWILDYLGSTECRFGAGTSDLDLSRYKELTRAFMAVSRSIVFAYEDWTLGVDPMFVDDSITHALSVILAWFEANKLDFEAIARCKHEYNKTRPYKHGKAF